MNLLENHSVLTSFFCRECKDITTHVVLEIDTESPQFDHAVIQCHKEHQEPFTVSYKKGQAPTQYSKRVEMANPEE